MQAKIGLENAAVEALGPYVKAVNALNEKTLALIKSFNVLIDLATGKSKDDDGEIRRRVSNLAGKNVSNTLDTTIASRVSEERLKEIAQEYKNPNRAGGTISNVEKLRNLALGGDEDAVAQLKSMGYNENGEPATGGRNEFAVGGIARGPTSGYPATLHGTEAVLPPDLTAMLIDASQTRQSENSRITELLAANSNFGEQAQRTTQASDDLMTTLISKVDDLISATKSVANYTEMTAHRIA